MKHELSKNENFFKLMHILSHMKDRCYNERCKDYKYYGGRGIKIDELWKDKEKGTLNFYNWAMENRISKRFNNR